MKCDGIYAPGDGELPTCFPFKTSEEEETEESVPAKVDCSSRVNGFLLAINIMLTLILICFVLLTVSPKLRVELRRVLKLAKIFKNNF
jgi:hypothetical protein